MTRIRMDAPPPERTTPTRSRTTDTPTRPRLRRKADAVEKILALAEQLTAEQRRDLVYRLAKM